MTNKHLQGLARLIAALAVLTSSSVAQAGASGAHDWRDIACRQVPLRDTSDVIRFTVHRHNYEVIRAHLRRGDDIEAVAVRVVYDGGQPEEFSLNRVVHRGEWSPELTLAGWEHPIEHIELSYRPVQRALGRSALVCAQGLVARTQLLHGLPPPEVNEVKGAGHGDWKVLGCRSVSLFWTDHDSIQVGRYEGRSTAIRLYVLGADIHLLDLTVIYANGAPDEIAVQQYIREGEGTRPLDLTGFDRAIHRIDLAYHTVPYSGGLATVCVESFS